jgi:hypothetical protein
VKTRHTYFAQEGGPDRLVKIGASNNPPRRARSISRAIGTPVDLLGVLHGRGHEGERATHRLFAACRVPDAPLPTTEWFRPTPDLLAFIAERAETYRPPERKPARARAAAEVGEPWVRSDEAAAFLGWTRERLRAEAKAGRVPHVRLPPSAHGHFRFKLSQIANLRSAA